MSARPPSGAATRDAGSATLWTAGAIVALALLAVAVLTVGTATATSHRATSAADLAALAAAEYAPDGEPEACHRARWVTDRMRVQLRGCRLAGWDALIEVRAQLPDILARFGSVTAHARAGPVDP